MTGPIGRSIASCIAALLVLPLAANASEPPEEIDYFKLGPYFGVSAGAGWTNLRSDEDIDSNMGIHGRIGVRVLRPYALEVHVEHLWNLQGPRDTTSIMLDNRLYPTAFFDMPGRLQPYAVFGLGVLIDQRESSGSDESGFAMRFGLGLDFYLTESLSVVGETGYVMATGPRVDDRDYFSLGVGLQYRFD
jgi:hypothetical protein